MSVATNYGNVASLPNDAETTPQKSTQDPPGENAKQSTGGIQIINLMVKKRAA